MNAEDRQFRYAMTMNRFAIVHHYHADREDRWSSWSAAAAVNPFMARWARPDSDSDSVVGTDLPGTAAVDPAGDRPAVDDGLAPLLTAAERAHVLYPGPVGELIHREIHAYLEIGHRFGGNTLVSRLAEQLLAAPQHEPVAAGPIPADPGGAS